MLIGYPEALAHVAGTHPSYTYTNGGKSVSFKVWEFVAGSDTEYTEPQATEKNTNRKRRHREKREKSKLEVEIVEDKTDELRAFRVDIPTPHPDITVYIDIYRFLDTVKRGGKLEVTD